MAQIKLILNEPLIDGMDVKFKAPCDCTGVTGLVVQYMTDGDIRDEKSFVFKDAHGSLLSNVGNLFVKNTYLKAILDTTNGIAYLQNANTNAYLENALSGKAASTHSHSNYLPTSGGTLTGQLKTKGIVLTSGTDYGTSLPSAGKAGRLFFKKVT